MPNIGIRLVRKAFSEDEWALLSAQPGFLDRMNTVTDVDEADVVIRAGAEIIERLSKDRQSPDGDPRFGARA